MRRLLNILFICTGNICRSPMAEAMFLQRLRRDYPYLEDAVNVSSSGTSAIDGNPATFTAVQAMDLWDVDLEPHNASVLLPSVLEDADLVVAMSREHLLSVERMAPQALHKSVTLKYLARKSGEILASLGEETVGDEEQARRRLVEVLDLLRRSPQGGDLLTDIYELGSDIIDPIGSSLQVYMDVAEEIDQALEEVMRALFGRPGGPDARREAS